MDIFFILKYFLFEDAISGFCVEAFARAARHNISPSSWGVTAPGQGRMQDEHAITRAKPEFTAHVNRMMKPLKPGFTLVKSMEFITEEFEVEYAVEFEPLKQDILDRVRVDTARNIESLEAFTIETLEKSAIGFMEQPDMYDGENFTWNASNPEDLTTNLAAFMDSIVRLWYEYEFPTYEEVVANDSTLSVAEREVMLFYIKNYVGRAASEIPYHVEEVDGVYYDSSSELNDLIEDYASAETRPGSDNEFTE